MLVCFFFVIPTMDIKQYSLKPCILRKNRRCYKTKINLSSKYVRYFCFWLFWSPGFVWTSLSCFMVVKKLFSYRWSLQHVSQSVLSQTASFSPIPGQKLTKQPLSLQENSKDFYILVRSIHLQSLYLLQIAFMGGQWELLP